MRVLSCPKGMSTGCHTKPNGGTRWGGGGELSPLPQRRFNRIQHLQNAASWVTPLLRRAPGGSWPLRREAARAAGGSRRRLGGRGLARGPWGYLNSTAVSRGLGSHKERAGLGGARVLEGTAGRLQAGRGGRRVPGEGARAAEGGRVRWTRSECGGRRRTEPGGKAGGGR